LATQESQEENIQMSAAAEADVRFVILHRPGSAWERGVDFREQPGVRDHVEHYRQIHEKGLLQMGGPFLTPDSGGMMIPVAGISEEEARRMAESDPAVRAGLLEVEVRPWTVAMKSI
jgi:uncharacterized protein YciI